MNLWEGFLAALAFGAISALTFIAYKHPKGYDRMHWPLQIAAMLIFIGVISYDMGRHVGISDTIEANRDDETSRMLSRPDSGGMNFLIVMPIFFGVNIYLSFLSSLHMILGIDEKEKEEQKPKTKSKDKDN